MQMNTVRKQFAPQGASQLFPNREAFCQSCKGNIGKKKK